MAKSKTRSESMKDNKNAETWTLNEAIDFFHEALDLSDSEEYDFIGEVAKDLKQDKGIFDYLINKFPNEHFKAIKNHILGNCEVNCFRNSKKGRIKEATAIVNLKSNHGWTDRSQIENNVIISPQKIKWGDKEIEI